MTAGVTFGGCGGEYGLMTELSPSAVVLFSSEAFGTACPCIEGLVG